MARSPLERSLALAVAMHALAAVFVTRGRAPAPVAAPPPPALSSAVEIDVSEEIVAPVPIPPPMPERHATRAPTEAREPREPRAVQPTGETPSAPDAPIAPTPDVSRGSADDPTAGASPVPSPSPSPTPPVSLEALGLRGPNRFMGSAREANAPSPAEDARRVERALTEPLLQRDKDLGLGADGPVLAALEEATSAGTAPVEGRAVFRVTADSSGAVTELVALDVSHDRRSWDDVAGRARGSLRGRALRVPSRAKGVTMRIEVTSAYKMPSGHDPGVDLRVLGVPVKRGAGKQSSKIDILNPIPKLETVEILLPGGQTLKLPSVQINVTILGIHGDPVDIGARPRRIVHAHVLDETLL